MTPLTIERICHSMRGLPWLTAHQIADTLAVPGDEYGAFRRLLREAADSGFVECRQNHNGWFPQWEWRVKE